MPLVLATCQLATTSDVRANADRVVALVRRAAARGAHLAHFPEACISGYAGADVASHAGTDWALVAEGLRAVADAARRHHTWVVVGSAHRLTPPHKPHNSLYVLDDRGVLVDRYDKRFCAGDRRGRTGDLAHYTPGDRLVTFDVRGVRCGLQVCHDFRYPELYRAYGRRGVSLMLHSFHAGAIPPARYAAMRRGVGATGARLSGGATLPAITMRAGMITAAADNHVWISCPNSSAHRSCWPSFVVRPDGVVTGRLRPDRAGVLLTTIDPAAPYYDSTAAWRGRAVAGRLHSGRLVVDPRSAPTTAP